MRQAKADTWLLPVDGISHCAFCRTRGVVSFFPGGGGLGGLWMGRRGGRVPSGLSKLQQLNAPLLDLEVRGLGTPRASGRGPRGGRHPQSPFVSLTSFM